MANKLIGEQSPYLLQHAHNPVNWYPWGDEAFDRAKEEHKPVIVSIGYAACHWCHVMEHESFEDAETAAYMNEHFVCIKVDREEHPDVDHMYMDAVQAIGGSGGWPLNVFVTPDRAPFYGGTYYPPRPAYNRPSWVQLLQRMNEIWQHQQDEVAQQAEQMIRHLRQASQRLATADVKDIDEGITRRIADTLLKMADNEWGGFGNAPKFPGTMAISYLIEHYHFTGYEPALRHALRSLDAMIEGGIYDQLGGGFARYSTDREWLAPHFEKMLYDNALLVSVLCDGYSVSKSERYKQVIQETIAFVERELKDETGGYYCALDADSEGEEGKFYTWTWDEWIAALLENDRVVQQYFGVKETGNWEGTNILHVGKSIAQLATENNISEKEVEKRITDVKCKLLAVRATRVRPLTDDKSLLSWNALMNIALTKGGSVIDKTYLVRASEHMDWMLANFAKDGELQHAWKKGVAKIPAKLDDYAYLILALLQLSSAAGDNSRIVKAIELMDLVLRDFSQGDTYFYFTGEGQNDIPVRKVDLYDGAIPSANAIICHCLTLISMCTQEMRWMERSELMLKNISGTTEKYSYSFSYWALLLQRKLKGWKTVVIAGPEANSYYTTIASNYIPQAFLLTLQKEISILPLFEKKYFAGKMSIFVCSEQACLSPVSAVDEAISLINQ